MNAQTTLAELRLIKERDEFVKAKRQQRRNKAESKASPMASNEQRTNAKSWDNPTDHRMSGSVVCPVTKKRFASKRAAQEYYSKLAKEQTRLTNGKNMNAKAKDIGPAFRTDKKGQPLSPPLNGTYRERPNSQKPQRFKNFAKSG